MATFAFTTPTLKAAEQMGPRGCEPRGSGDAQTYFPLPGLSVLSEVSSFCLQQRGDEIRNGIRK